MQHKIFMAFLVTLLFTACGNKKSKTQEVNSSGCPPDMMCTMIFKSISVTVKAKTGEPVKLDHYFSTLASTGDTLVQSNRDQNYNSHEGSYPIANDGSMKKVGKAGSEVVFKGFRNGKQVVQHSMIIGHDCCHIATVSGSDEAIVQD